MDLKWKAIMVIVVFVLFVATFLVVTDERLAQYWQAQPMMPAAVGR